MAGKPKLAFWWRYGPADNVELAHATPVIIEKLAEHVELHYFSLRGSHPVPESIQQHCKLHLFPAGVNRSSSLDKLLKTLLWYFLLPWVGLRCRMMGIRTIYIDDYLPVGSWIARVFSGANVSIFVVDFLLDAYAEKNPVFRPFVAAANALDASTWRKLPLIFTRTNYAGQYLHEKVGVPRAHLATAYDANDENLYHPVDRNEARQKMGYKQDELVLVHHGVLHPNKSIDRIMNALPPLMEEFPRFRFLIVGSGPEEDNLKKQADDLGIRDKVKFTGWLATASEVNVGLNAADIGLVMRAGHHTDHFHLTGALVHSMAVGLAVLAPKLNGISEVVEDGRNGFLFDPSDMNTFQEVCRRLLADKELRNHCSQQALDDAKRLFSLEHSADCVVQPLLKLARSE